MTTASSNIKDIFARAIEIDSHAERQAFIVDACGDNASLRAEIDALLNALDQAGSFMKPVGPSAPPAYAPTITERPLTEAPGTVIGSYKLLEQIGEGGFGVVFMAEQIAPVKRKVALKVIKPGMDTRQVIARFEAERQALALMDHPHIARVLDAGATDTGRPYFVMELVKGVPITEYCDQHQLSPRQRLELFLDVCHAVQHAHQKGIIHRDIKPTNVLVSLHDDKPVAKVIDFGIAKATSGQLTDKTLFTGFAQLIGTPLYMSPEQAAVSGIDVDTRADIYSLGVLLYELLTGTTPFDKSRLQAAAFDEVRRIIREEEPQKPSTRLSSLGDTLPSVSAQRKMEPRKLSQLIRGDLDWIVMKALEKDRNRRYETANGLAGDVQRYLNDEAVQACPPSFASRFRKFARRNKRGLASAVVLALAVLAIAATVGWAIRDRDAHAQEAARDKAARQLAVEQAARRALELADDFQKQGKWQESLVAVQRAEAALASGEGGTNLQQQVNDQLAHLHVIQRLDEPSSDVGGIIPHESQNRAYARIFADLGIDVESLSPAEVAARIRRRPSTAVRVAAALDDWSRVLRDWGLFDRSKRDPANWKRLLEAARLADPDPWRSQLRQLMGQEDLNALRRLADSSDLTALPVQSLLLMGAALAFAGDGPACVAWLRKAHRQHPGDALISHDLAFHLSLSPSAPWDEVLQFYEAALAARPQSAGMHNSLGNALTKSGRYDEAINCYKRAVELNPNLAGAHNALGNALREQKKLDEAIAYFKKTIELDPTNADAHANLGLVLADQAKSDEAAACFHQAIDIRQELVEQSPASTEYRWALANDWDRLGYVLARQKRFAQAESAYRESKSIWEELSAESHLDDHRTRLGGTLLNWAGACTADGRPQDAEKFFREAAVEFETLQTDFPNQSRWAIHELGFIHLSLGELLSGLANRDQDAEQAYRQSLTFHEEQLTQDPGNADYQQRLMRSYAGLANLLRKTDRRSEAVRLDGQRMALAMKFAPSATLAGEMNNSAWQLATDPDPELRDPIQAVELARMAVELAPLDATHWNTLGTAHYRAGDWNAAIDALMKAEDLLGGGYFSFNGFFLAMAHWQRGEKEQAVKWYAPALVWMAKYAAMNDELLRFRAEAASCLGVPETLTAEQELAKADDVTFYTLVLDARPKAVWAYGARGSAYAERGQWEEAAAEFTKAAETKKGDPLLCYHQALLRLRLADVEGYRKLCTGMLGNSSPAAKTDAPHWAIAWTCALAGDAVVDWRVPLQFAEKGVAVNSRNYRSLNQYGAVLYRAGRYEESLKRLAEAEAAYRTDDEKMTDIACNWLFLAMVHHRLGHNEEARKWHDMALARIDQELEKKSEESGVATSLPWNRRLTLQLLRREAEELLKTTNGM